MGVGSISVRVVSIEWKYLFRLGCSVFIDEKGFGLYLWLVFEEVCYLGSYKGF